MSLLADRQWKLKYTPEDGDLVRIFYIPALEDAVRYDRLTGYFNAQALTLAARGIEGLVRNNGRMRMVVGCTLNPPEIEAIEKGEKLRDLVAQHLSNSPLEPPNAKSKDALELLAWMIAHSYLEVKVAVPCDKNRNPIPADGIFHEKSGIIEDKVGDKVAWNGSLNETGAGWVHNWESFNVFTSWGQEPERVEEEEINFVRLWANQSKRVITLDVPSAVRDDLMRYMPEDDRPARLKEKEIIEEDQAPKEKIDPISLPVESSNLRRLVWGYVHYAPLFPNGGERVGEATAAVTPWPHQVRAYERLYHRWPSKLLIADEVGLGKTIQAGMLLRQAWITRKAKRILILTPKALLKQWQIELREKFNLNWPIYDGQKLIWYPSPALRGNNERSVEKDSWHKEPVVITSSQLMRRQNRTPELLDQAEPWDLIVLDEAHHARRRAAGAVKEGGPNALLRLMQGLRGKTQGLVLLTATPMQVHPVEVWDLLNLLGLPSEWTPTAFLNFFDDAAASNPSQEAFERMARLFQSVESFFGPLDEKDAARATGLSSFKTGRILKALRHDSSIPRRQLETNERLAAVRVMKGNTPLRQLVSRHTRELLRRYYKAGMIDTPIANRNVEDRFISLTPAEQALYEAVEDYISTTYNQASQKERNAVGFVMTIYRRRLSSSFHALEQTLQSHLESVGAAQLSAAAVARLDEDIPDDEEMDDGLDTDDAAEIERQALAVEEKSDIERLLARVKELPPDSKLIALKNELLTLRRDGYKQVMVFTQYTDTMDFLRNELRRLPDLRIMTFSGRGGEVLSSDGTWMLISRDDIKRRFKNGEADILLCTDAAAEGLNFQFCGAMVNYDMPWNPMRVEQRIGRIDRLGQKHENIRIVNLHYEGTVETDVYRALRERIGLFQNVIGKLQPILAQLPKRIIATVLSGESRKDDTRAAVVSELEGEADAIEHGGFDIDTVTDSELVQPVRPESPLTLGDLDLVLNKDAVLPPGLVVKPMGPRQFSYSMPGMKEPVRVTTSAEFYEEHSESVELWSQGCPAFPIPENIATEEELSNVLSLEQLLGKRDQ